MNKKSITDIYFSYGISKRSFVLIFILLFVIGFIFGNFINIHKHEVYNKYSISKIIEQKNLIDGEIEDLDIINNPVIENKLNETRHEQIPDNRLHETSIAKVKNRNVLFQKKKVNRNLPKWQVNALNFKVKNNIPMIAIIIDDMGLDIIRSNKVLEINAPLTTSYMTYAVNLQNQINSAKSKGKEIMLHVPMEAKSEAYDEGPDVLKTSYDSAQLQKIIKQQISKSDAIVGINNHMGSKFTEHFASMSTILQIVKDAGLIFVDSKTSQKSVGEKVAKIIEMPHLTRDIFLDHYPEEKEIEQQLKMLESFAKRKGYAIAIGHPRDNTINVLKKWIPDVQNRGFQIVPITTIIKHINNL